MRGYLHSIETFGALDGPGLRCVVFLQGCPLRCRYCHNPDSWLLTDGQEIDSSEVLARIARSKPYFGATGGVTLSGGEPFMQAEFAAEILHCCRQASIHTAVDTSGFYLNSQVHAALADVDLVMLDIKHTNPQAHYQLTGQALTGPLNFLRVVAESGIPLWVRHVIVPGWTDTLAEVLRLVPLLQDIPSLQQISLLPYHTLGVAKWAKLQIPYPLTGVQPPDASTLAWLRDGLSEALPLIQILVS